MKRYLLLLIASCALVSWGVYSKLVDNMHVTDFYLNAWPQVTCSETSDEVKKETRTILSQPFTYLGKGRQFFVFESKDKKWVLKFIKCQRFNEWYQGIWGLDQLALLRRERLAEKAKKISQLFASVALAAGRLRDESGVLSAHLIQKEEYGVEVTVIDRLGISHKVRVDEVPFVLQKKAEQVMPVLQEANREALAKRLEQLCVLFSSLAAKQAIDIDDGAIRRGNIGFLDERAIYIDVGTFRNDPFASKRLARDLKRLDLVACWLKGHDEALFQQFETQITKSKNDQN
jgi:hypothetical protein